MKENGLDEQYINLLKDILENGVEKETRNGKVISVFGRTIRFKFNGNNFPLLTTKKMPFKTIVTELLWFLRGDTNIKYLVDNNCHIWDGDAYKRYWFNWRPIKEDCGEDLTPYTQEEFINKIKTDDEFAKKWGELGKIYGKQWRSWEVDTSYLGNDEWSESKDIDQIQNLISDLKTNPDSRRLMVNAWNVGELDAMVLPPCHYGFQVYTRELSLEEREEILIGRFYKMTVPPIFSQTSISDDLKNNNIPTRAISLMWNQRSVDTFLGLPFNIASYGLLLEIIAKEVNMVPEELIGNLGDVHLYSNHIEQAKEQIGRELTLDERLDLADVFNSLIREDCLTKTHNEDETEELKLVYRNEWLDGLGVIPKRTRESFPLPTLKKLPNYRCIEENWKCYEIEDIRIDNYQSHPTIKAPLSN